MEKKLRWEDCVNCAEFTKLLLSIIAQRDLLLKTVETLAVLSWQSGRQENHKSLIFSTWESNNCCLYQGRASDYKISRDRGVEKHFNTMHWISCFDFSNPDIVQQRGVTSAAAVAAAPLLPGGKQDPAASITLDPALPPCTPPLHPERGILSEELYPRKYARAMKVSFSLFTWTFVIDISRDPFVLSISKLWWRVGNCCNTLIGLLSEPAWLCKHGYYSSCLILFTSPSHR